MLLQFADESALVSFVIKQKLPEWQTKLFNKNAEAVQVHSQGHIFHKIDQLFPNEHPDSKAHRIIAFESITEASFGRAANNVNRIFKNSSYTVEASEKTIDFAAEDQFEGLNFYNWFLDQWTKFALKEDPNSRIVIYPPEYADKMQRPIVVFVPSCHIKYMDDDQVIFVSELESEVEYDLSEVVVSSEMFYDASINRMNSKHGTKNTYTPKFTSTIKRYVYHAFFRGVGFYRIEQDKERGNEYDVTFYPFKHDFLPVTDAGGEKGNNDINKSFLHPFVPFGNLALLQHSQHTAVNFMYSFPRMSEIQTPCDNEACQDGLVLYEPGSPMAIQFPEGRQCDRCKGVGHTTNQTPYKVYRKNFDPAGMEGDSKYLEVPDVQFYTPDTSILDYSKNEWKNYLEMAETAVYIQQRVQTGNVEAAESKEIDREDLYAFLFRVGQVYFGKLRFALQSLENYLVGSPIQVNVNTPYSYAILSEGEAYEALKDILSSNVPTMLKANQVEGFINKFVSQSSPIKKFIEVLKIIDPLLYYTNAEIAGFKSNMIVTDEQYAVHVFAYPVLQRMYFGDKEIFFLETQEIVNRLTKELILYKPKPVEDIKTKLTKQLGNAE